MTEEITASGYSAEAEISKLKTGKNELLTRAVIAEAKLGALQDAFDVLVEKLMDRVGR